MKIFNIIERKRIPNIIIIIHIFHIFTAKIITIYIRLAVIVMN